MQEARYEINGKVYYQRPLVLGQIEQLTEAVEGLVLPDQNLSLQSVVKLLGSKLPRLIAIVLREPNRLLHDKDVPALTAEMAEHVDMETAQRMVSDFFAFSPPTLLSEVLGNLVGAMVARRKIMDMVGSETSASSSQGETSPRETVSSGATHSESASPMPSTETVK